MQWRCRKEAADAMSADLLSAGLAPQDHVQLPMDILFQSELKLHLCSDSAITSRRQFAFPVGSLRTLKLDFFLSSRMPNGKQIIM